MKSTIHKAGLSIVVVFLIILSIIILLDNIPSCQMFRIQVTTDDCTIPVAPAQAIQIHSSLLPRLRSVECLNCKLSEQYASEQTIFENITLTIEDSEQSTFWFEIGELGQRSPGQTSLDVKHFRTPPIPQQTISFRTKDSTPISITLQPQYSVGIQLLKQAGQEEYQRIKDIPLTVTTLGSESHLIINFSDIYEGPLFEGPIIGSNGTIDIKNSVISNWYFANLSLIPPKSPPQGLTTHLAESQKVETLFGAQKVGGMFLTMSGKASTLDCGETKFQHSLLDAINPRLQFVAIILSIISLTITMSTTKWSAPQTERKHTHSEDHEDEEPK